MLSPHLRPLALLLAAGLATPALAEPPPPHNQVSLQAEVSQALTNDLMTATLFVELEDSKPASLSRRLTEAVNGGVRVAKDATGVKASSGNIRHWPVTGKQGKIERWRGRAELNIESKDFKAAGDLIGRLQDTMQLEGVAFTVSPEARRARENALIGEAVAAFRQRAELAQKAFGAQGYELVNVSINTAGQGPIMPMARGMMMKAEMADAPAPEFAAGESQIMVTVGGTVELKP